jgi:hypothetical protein
MAALIHWPTVIARAVWIVDGYGRVPVTLRQLFYRLVAAELIPNKTHAYQHLSRWTAIRLTRLMRLLAASVRACVNLA